MLKTESNLFSLLFTIFTIFSICLSVACIERHAQHLRQFQSTPGSLTNPRWRMRASIIPMARVTVYSRFWKSQSNSGDWGQHSSPLTSNPNLEMWQRRQRGPALSRSSKFLPFYNSENAPFELGGGQIIYRFSGGIPAPKLLFALAAMTEGKEFEQCLCIIDSFPLSSCPPQREEILLNNII